MATITTSTASPVFQYPGNSYADMNPARGQVYVMVKNTAGDFELFRTTDNGASWVTVCTMVRANVQEWSNIYIDNLGLLHWAFRTNETSQDRIYYRRLDLRPGTPSWTPATGNASTTELLVATPGNAGVGGSYHQGLSIAVVVTRPFASGNVYVAIAAGTTIGANHGVQMYGVIVRATNSGATAATASQSVVAGTREWMSAGSGAIRPSIDIQHTGDGKSDGNNCNLWITWGRTFIRMVRMSWGTASGYGWTGPISPTVIKTGVTAMESSTGRYDGSRFLMTEPRSDFVVVYQRNAANTSTTSLQSPVHTTGVVKNCTLAYNSSTGDFRLYAVGTSTTVLYYIDYTRATGTWSTWQTVLATAVLGTNGDNWGVVRNNKYNYKYTVYSAHAGPLQISTTQGISVAPNAPIWVTPNTGTPQDVKQNLLLDWNFSDPDPSDTQSAYAVSRQIGAGALNYWRASDSTWQVAEVQNTSSNTFLNLLPGWAAASDAAYTFKVKTWDNVSNPGNYSVANVVIPSDRFQPVITLPGPTVTTDKVTVAWTVTEQTAARLRLYQSGAVENVNPYFETNASNWTGSGGATLTRSLTQFHDGAASLRLAPDGTTANPTAKNDERATVPGISNYSAEGWIFPTATCTIEFGIQWNDAAHATISTESYISTTTLGAWYRFGILGTPPANAAFAVVYYRVVGIPANTNFIYGDGLELRQVSGLAKDSGWTLPPGDFDFQIPYTLADLTNNWLIILEVRNNEGLSCLPEFDHFNVDFIEPAIPYLYAIGVPEQGIIRVQLINAAPTGLNTFVAAGAAVTGNNTSITPGLPAGIQRQDLLVILASIRNSGTGTVNVPTGWVQMLAFGNMSLLARYADLTSLDNPLVTFAGGAASADTLAQMAAFRGAAIGPLSNSATVLNGSVQDIAYPSLTVGVNNQTVIVAGWKQNSWTSVATLAGMAEIGDFFSSAGSTAGEVWDYVIQTTAANITGANLTVTGGIAAISRGVTVSIDVMPAFASQDIFRREVGDGTNGIRIAADQIANVAYDDYTVTSGKVYEYRSLVKAVNGTSIYGPWTA